MTPTHSTAGGRTAEERKTKILAAIDARGWFTAEIYPREADELRIAGVIKRGERFSVGANRKSVWVSA
jgi:hypothetical protein